MAFPTIKRSLFCGEALPTDLAASWCDATPNGSTENWYGPTEATIACTYYNVDPNNLPKSGVIPIGQPFEGTTALVLDDDLNPTADGQVGALFVGGPQVASGYLNNPNLSAQSFLTIPGYNGSFYRTGDLAKWQGGLLYFHGRADHQVKIRGYRVELQEIENALRRHLNGCNVIAMAWPPNTHSGTHILCAAEGLKENAQEILDAVRSELPTYMVPASMLSLDHFPRNSSGKIDRNAMA